jgi:hypothetical protein
MWKTDQKFGKSVLSVKENIRKSVGRHNRVNLFVDEELGEINGILDHPRFTRVWIIQQAILACELLLMCGSETTILTIRN